MGARGGQSSAAMAVAPVPIPARRPAPPKGLPDAAAEVWRDIVTTCPADWFNRSHYPMLAAYCRHSVRADELAELIADFEGEWLKVDGGLARLDKLLAMAARETTAMLACARAMRITHQAQIQPRSAARRMAGGGRPRPWDGDDRGFDGSVGLDPMFDDYDAG